MPQTIDSPISDFEVRRDLVTRQLPLRNQSVDEETRSFEAVVATETRARVFDMRSYEVIEEILIARGGQFPESVPLLHNHMRFDLDDVFGSADSFVRTGGEWVGRGRVARAIGENDPVERAWRKIVDGHVRAVSIGYQVRECKDIRPGRREEIDGRVFEAGDAILRVSTVWSVHELSLTPIGADDRALIRKQAEPVRKKFRSMFR